MVYSLTGSITKPVNSNPVHNPPSHGGDQSVPYVKNVLIGSISSGTNNVVATKDLSGNVTLTFTLNNGSTTNQTFIDNFLSAVSGISASALLDLILAALGISSFAELEKQILILQSEIAISNAKIDIITLDVINLQQQNTLLEQQIVVLNNKTFAITYDTISTNFLGNVTVIGDVISNNFFQSIIDNVPRAGIIQQF